MKNFFLISALVLIAAVAAYGATRPASEKIIEQIKQGAQAANVVDGPCLISPDGGGHICPLIVPLMAATTTVCAIQSPNATSTLVIPGSGLNLTLGTSTALRIWFSKASSRFAATTTNQFNTATLAASLKGFIMATTSLNGGVATSITAGTTATDLPLVFAPGTWLRVEIADGIVSSGVGFGGFGSCRATFTY